MRVFLEIYQVQESSEAASLFPPQFVRIDVTGMTEDQIVQKARELLQILGWKSFHVQIHYCYHDEGQPCRVKDITKLVKGE